MPSRDDFISRFLSPARPGLVPEVELYLATELTPLWHATAEVLERHDVPSPFWAFAWSGGQALARYVLDHPTLVRGKRVVDFASGSGLVGIAAARSGAERVLATEIDDWAETIVPMNAALNGVTLEVSCRDIIGTELDADVLLAGDIFYEPALAAQGLAWMRQQARRGVRVLVGDPGRLYSPPGLRELGRYLVPTTTEIEDSALRETLVLEVL